MLSVAGEECGTFNVVTVRPTADGAAKSDPLKTESFSERLPLCYVRITCVITNTCGVPSGCAV